MSDSEDQHDLEELRRKASEFEEKLRAERAAAKTPLEGRNRSILPTLFKAAALIAVALFVGPLVVRFGVYALAGIGLFALCFWYLSRSADR